MSAVELGPVWLSLELAAVTTIVLLVIGTPLAWWLAWTSSRTRPVVEALVALPLVLPPTVLGFYLLVLLGPAGTIGRFWVDLTGSTLTFPFSVGATAILNPLPPTPPLFVDLLRLMGVADEHHLDTLVAPL